jgi:hypothetical protein
LADALLHPQDRAYTVPQLFDFIENCELRFGRWLRQAPYLPQCGDLAKTPHTARLAILPQREQYAAVELFRGSMLRHNLIVYRDDRPSNLPQFDGEGWLTYVPIRLPESISVQKRLPPGAAAVLIIQSHTDPDLFYQSVPQSFARLKPSMASGASQISSIMFRYLEPAACASPAIWRAAFSSSFGSTIRSFSMFRTREVVEMDKTVDPMRESMDRPLSLWNNTPVRQVILDFVSAVATPGSLDFIPPVERIATLTMMARCGAKNRLIFSFSLPSIA